jgi:hypothetical protein
MRSNAAPLVTTIALLLALTAPASPLGAQDGDLPHGRARVRLEVGGPIEGVYVGRTKDSLLMVFDGSDTTRMALSEVKELELSLGTERHPLKGLLLGAAWGAAISGTIAFAGTPARGNPDSLIPEHSPAQAALIEGSFGALVCAPIGLIIGALNQTEHWLPQAIPQLDLRIAPRTASQRGTRIAVLVSVPLRR